MVGKILSREELVSGGLNRSRRAAKLLAAIESRCLYMRNESRQVINAYLLEGGQGFKRQFDKDYIQRLKRIATSDEALHLEHIERFAAQWKPLVPADPDLRARVLRLVHQKYGLGPNTLSALCSLGPEVEAAYKHLFGEPFYLQPAILGDELETAQDQPGGSAPRAHEDIETCLEWLSLAGGETLFHSGEPGDALYVVISGRLQAVIEGEAGKEHIIGEIGRGELVGEMAVLTGDPRSATIRAVRDSELVRLSRRDLLSLAKQHLEVMVQINALIARRLQKQYANPGRKENTLQTFTLLPCDSGVPIQDFGCQLVQEMSKFGPTIYITKAIIEENLEPGAAQASLEDPRNPQVVSWLNELEARYQYVIYEATPDDSEWSRRCLRQSDQIVLVGQAIASPQPASHEVVLLSRYTPEKLPNASRQPAGLDSSNTNHVDLVLLHEPDISSPSGTAGWLAPRSIRAHHHVRFGEVQDMAHLARCLTGHALGLVLAGGGARGFAHIGVLRVLEEAGIQVDIVGGTSMGAIITGGIGLGLNWKQMREIASGLSSPLKLFDPTLPVVSLFTSSKVNNTLQKVFGEALIEDLWHPMYCVSSNLTRSSETVYRQGPLWKAVRASMSIPGIFAPILYQGDVQVDGAVMNNLPIDIMRNLGMAGTVIGVNVMPLEDTMKEYSFGDSISGPRAVFSMLNPYDSTSVPMIYETLVRVMALHEVHQEEAKRRLADIYIVPPVEKYNILDFGSYDPIIEAGYRAAQEAFKAWKGQSAVPLEVSSPPRAKAPLRQLESTLAELENTLSHLGKSN